MVDKPDAVVIAELVATRIARLVSSPPIPLVEIIVPLDAFLALEKQMEGMYGAEMVKDGSIRSPGAFWYGSVKFRIP